jgi:phytanoyl-CoA hydroxylase
LTARDGTPLPDRASDHGVGADLPAFVRDGALALRRPAALVDLERALADYRELGLGSLGVVVAEPALEALRARADAIMDGQHRDEDLFFQHDAESGKYEDLAYGQGFVGPSRSYRKIDRLDRDPVFRAFLENPLFERVVRSVIEGAVTIYRAVLFSKAPQGGTVLPYHQDGGNFWGLSESPVLQIWTALDDAPAEAGCLEMVPGTHKGGLATPLGGVVPENKLREARVEERKVLVPARAGEVLLVHNHLFHGSGVNATDKPRRGLTVCYMSASVRCMRTRRPPRVFPRVFEGSGPIPGR